MDPQRNSIQNHAAPPVFGAALTLQDIEIIGARMHARWGQSPSS
jgi:hypothetical protein